MASFCKVMFCLGTLACGLSHEVQINWLQNVHIGIIILFPLNFKISVYHKITLNLWNKLLKWKMLWKGCTRSECTFLSLTKKKSLTNEIAEIAALKHNIVCSPFFSTLYSILQCKFIFWIQRPKVLEYI